MRKCKHWGKATAKKVFIGRKRSKPVSERELADDFRKIGRQHALSGQWPHENGRLIKVDRPAATLGLPIARVHAIVEDLERHLFFLVRNEAGEISWAFPVTTEPTPHRLKFSTGERAHGA